jgi:uncharacterized protein
MPAVIVIAAAGLAAAIGGVVQSGVGLGVGLVASPVLTLLDPTLMPGSLLVATTLSPVLVLAREGTHADWRGISWAMAGRAAGTVAGVWVVAALSARLLGAVIGGVVLGVVALTGLGAFLPRNRWTLLAAGVISGTAGTATSIGGPPVALLYQRESGPRVRATLASFLAIGNALALTALAIAGQLPGRDIAVGLILLGCAAAGFAASGRVRGFLDAGHIRSAVLLVTALSAIALITRSLWG